MKHLFNYEADHALPKQPMSWGGKNVTSQNFNPDIHALKESVEKTKHT
jgi:hypothetical protein